MEGEIVSLLFLFFCIYPINYCPTIFLVWSINLTAEVEASQGQARVTTLLLQAKRMDPEELEDEELEEIRWTSLTFELVWHWRHLCRRYEDFTTIGFAFILGQSQYKSSTSHIQQTGFKIQYLKGRDVCEMHATLTSSVAYLEGLMFYPDAFGHSSNVPWMLDKLGLW